MPPPGLYSRVQHRGLSDLRRSLSRARANRLRRVPGGQLEPPRCLIERQSLEIAKNHRHAKRPGQSFDLVVENLGLLAAQRRLLGGSNSTAGSTGTLDPRPARVMTPLSSLRRWRSSRTLAFRAVRIATP